MHDAVHGPVGDLRRELVGEQVQGREGEPEVGARRSAAQIGGQPVAERRHAGAEAASGPSQPSSPPTFHRIAKSARTAQDALVDGSSEAASRTSRGKSSGPPRVGSAQTSSTRKSPVSSWMRQGRRVWAVFASLMASIIHA
jgi:hypothetical protein